MAFFLEERRKHILERILEHGRVSVNELSNDFGVSEVTIRNDLQALENLELIVRTHGGAIPNSPEFTDFALKKRIEKQAEEKNRIGEAAASRVSNGDTIFIDSSSTALAITRFLKNYQELTVVTNSLTVTQELIDTIGVSILLIGGLVQRDDASTTGLAGLGAIRNIAIQKGFFGAHGIDPQEGLTDLSQSVAEIKKTILPKCEERIAVLDATKWCKVGLASFAKTSEIDVIYTDQAVSPDLVKKIRKLGVEVITV